MNRLLNGVAHALLFLSLPAAVVADQFVIKLDAPLTGEDTALRETLGITEIERFVSGEVSFVVLDAQSDAYVEAYLYAKGVSPIGISAVEFINSPQVGGAEPAAPVAADEMTTFVIERPIPGVGSFPLERKEGISRASIAAMEQLGGSVEWVHSYLTDIGTFCVYRATDAGQIEEHAVLAGAPLGPITEVVPQVLD